MGFFDGYNVATSGMSAQRTRINVVSANIANAQTTHTIDGGPYKKQNVVFEEMLLSKNKAQDKFLPIEKTGDIPGLRGVGIKESSDISHGMVLLEVEVNATRKSDGRVLSRILRKTLQQP